MDRNGRLACSSEQKYVQKARLTMYFINDVEGNHYIPPSVRPEELTYPEV